MVKTLYDFFQNKSKVFFSLRSGIVAIIVATSFQSLYAANISLSPSSFTTKVGKTFTVDVLVTNNLDAINAVSGVLSFPQDALQVVSLSKSGSFITMWADEPAFSNTQGTASFEGVALNPGFSKASGKVISFTFKAKQAGNVNITVKSGSVLANDGNATDVIKVMGSAFVLINEDGSSEVVEQVSKVASETMTPVITSPTHPDGTLWYSKRDASFEWKLPPSVTAVKTLYSEKENGTPTKVYDPAISNRSFTVDTDGVMYMHVQFKNSSGWGSVAHYKFQVDSQAPESLKASFPDGVVTTNVTPAMLIVAEDSLSGINHITMSVDGGKPVELKLDPSNLYRLPKQVSGNHTVVVSAVDGAGNASTVSLDFTIQTISPPVITEFTKKVDYDTPLKIVGATYPKTSVEFSLTDRDGKVDIFTSTSNDTGVFNIVWPKKVETGVYEMRARVLDGKGAVSDFTDSKVIIVEKLAILRIGIFIMNWLSVVLIVIIAAVAISGTFWYSLVQFARFRRRVRRTIAEAENTLKTNVAALRRDTEEFHTILVKAERKRELTKEEQAILKKFKKRLDITEKEIEKKIEQIG